jgi:hypothetical protein
MVSRLRFGDFRATYCSIILICLILLIIVGCETYLRRHRALHFSASGGGAFSAYCLALRFSAFDEGQADVTR